MTNPLIVHLRHLAASAALQTDNTFFPVGPLKKHLVIEEHLPHQFCPFKKAQIIIDRSPAYPHAPLLRHLA